MKNKIDYQFVFSIFMFLTAINCTIAQNENFNENIIDETVFEESLISKNSIYGSFGTAIVLDSKSVYYERILRQSGSNKKYSSFLRIGYGIISGDVDSDQYLFSHYGWLTGTGKNHLEIGAGLMLINSKSIDLSGNIGWRWQMAGPSFILRIGIGVPDALYLSVGFSFG